MLTNWSNHMLNIQLLADKLNSSFFYYDLDAFEQHLKRMKIFPAKLWYAVKANPLSCVLNSLNSQSYRFDVASIGELRQVLRQGINPKNILHTGPAKSKEQLKTFLAQGVRIYIIESFQQLIDLNNLSMEMNISPKVLLRVQLSWDHIKEKNILGGNNISQFGLSVECWKNLTHEDHKYVNIIGLHIFQWGNILDQEKLRSIWSHSIPKLSALAEKLKIKLDVIDLGGGIGIPYAESEKAMDVNSVSKILQQVQQLCPNTTLWMELGRYAIGDFGCYATKVIDRKNIDGTEMLILDGGVNHLLRPGIIDQPFPVKLLRRSTNKKIPMRLHGPLCTSLDCLGTINLPNDIKINDWLLFSQCGAYGFTESMPFFLCHPLAGEVVHQNNEVNIVRNPELPEFWMK